MRSHDYFCQKNSGLLTRRASRSIIRARYGLGRPLRRVPLHGLIGGLSILLPLVLAIGNFISAGTSPPGSLSGYYYTDMRNFFIGGLCALGVFLLAYHGPERLDILITDCAGIGLIMVALLPTRPPVGGGLPLTAQQNVVGDLHDFFAIIAPLALGVMALRLARARRRPGAAIHRVCAATIFSCVIFAIARIFIFSSMNVDSRALLVCEVLAMLASGISWLTLRPLHDFPARESTMTPEPRELSIERPPFQLPLPLRGRP